MKKFYASCCSDCDDRLACDLVCERAHQDNYIALCKQALAKAIVTCLPLTYEVGEDELEACFDCFENESGVDGARATFLELGLLPDEAFELPQEEAPGCKYEGGKGCDDCTGPCSPY